MWLTEYGPRQPLTRSHGDQANAEKANDAMTQNYHVTANHICHDHTCPEHGCVNVGVTVVKDVIDSGHVGYSAHAASYGCTEQYPTPEAAIRALFAEHAASAITILKDAPVAAKTWPLSPLRGAERP